MAQAEGYAPNCLERREVRHWRECVMRKTSCLRSPPHPLPIAQAKGYAPKRLERREVRRQQGRARRAVKGLSST